MGSEIVTEGVDAAASDAASDAALKEESYKSEVRARIDIQLACSRYLRAEARYEDAAKEMFEASGELKAALGDRKRFIYKQDWQYFLVESDGENFEIEPIDAF